MRPLGLEYVVLRNLDGVTPAPAFGVPPAPDDYDPETQFISRTVDRLGLIDLTGLPGGSGQLADRLVKWIIILGPNPPFAADNVSVSFDGLIVQTDVEIPAGELGIYSRRCILVPQTAQLRLNGMAGFPDDPIIVRMGVWMPQTRLELAEMYQACCCTGAAVDDLGDPFFFVSLPLAA